MKKALIAAAGVVVVIVLIVLNLTSDKGSKTEVQVAKIERRDVSKVVTASGNIQPKRRVNVSASAMGKVTAVAVEEGDVVTEGDFLLEIDPTAYESAVERLSAAVRGAQATLELELATRKKAEQDYERAQELSKSGFVSGDELRDAAVAVEIAEARVKTAAEALSQNRANLGNAMHELDQVRITAEMSGVVTALNVEEGERAIMGTLNNPGTVLLTIADLSEMEAEVRVDETEVVSIEMGQPAKVRLDAFPDTSFAGVVSEVGNSAIRSQLGLGQESVDFKVVVTITDSIPNIRPGLSASVDITVAQVKDAVTVPIQCLTVRDEAKLRRGRDKDGDRGSDSEGEDSAGAGAEVDAAGEDENEAKEIEGVFVVEDGKAHFRRVSVGVAGQSYFSIESGLTEGETVVSGPFRAINDLRDGDAVKVKKKPKRGS